MCCGTARWTPPFGRVRAPSTLGTFLRCSTFGHVRQLDAVAARLVADALKTAKVAGAGGPDGIGLVVLRADSAYYGFEVIAAARRGGARFSVTARASPAISTAIASIDQDAWAPIHHLNAVWDEDGQRLINA